ncbi:MULTISPECIES: pilus assembly protein PilP [unclassified Janthinobacterium]|uniref:pilus assembly protein PilP n=1 Tax=unclassified Janthinobacterium TaxID=2610881 RepID=UPI0003452853|nr:MULTISPECIES: pilus assembly protein PilP [unclassified Janthinobacterium]MEC5159098.1 type IV pilus assembly protein PilP [Janthinobacterium sp. CG_S6]
MSAPRNAAAAAALLLALAGCGDSDVQEVRLWMAEVKAQARVAVPPLSEPKTFIPFAYGAKEAVDPFSPNKLLAELARAAKSSSGFKPDLERRKELLESYPLDTIKMVGTLQKAGVVYALLQIDRSVYQVRSGQHVGQNFGLITGVTEEAISIKEIVQDAGGDWVERMAKLELQDSKETK